MSIFQLKFIMHSATIIGITGRKYHGKDTVANYFIEKYGYHKISFADPLKEICQTLFGFSDEQVYGSLKETVDSDWNVTPRLVLQFVGTELFRENIGRILPDIGQDFWVRCAMIRINRILEKDPNARFVIPDIRFLDEIECFKNFTFRRSPVSFHTIRVVRPSIPVNEASIHPSETAIDTLPVDTVILNDKSIEELYIDIIKYL